MGQNIGTCITAILLSVGTNKNAKRAAFLHLFFNIVGTVVLLIVSVIVKALIAPVILDEAASPVGIAVAHSAFNIICTVFLYPASGLLEKLVIKLVPDSGKTQEIPELDERLLQTPPVALDICHKLTVEMATVSVNSFKTALTAFDGYSKELAEEIRKAEDITDHYEDILGTYLVKLSGHQVSEAESAEIAKLLKLIGDFERISDHSVDLIESIEELRDKEIVFSQGAKAELDTLFAALREILDLALDSFIHNDLDAVSNIEPLETVIDRLKEKMRSRHILRLQQGDCTIEAGFIWSDLLTNLERTSDHCSNIAGCIFDVAHNNMNIHESLKEIRDDITVFNQKYAEYKAKYALSNM